MEKTVKIPFTRGHTTEEDIEKYIYKCYERTDSGTYEILGLFFLDWCAS